jgi:hypothetical protein
MFGLKRKSAVHRPSAEMCRALETIGLPPGVADATAFRVVEQTGSYSGRKVTHVRVFDPAAVAARNVSVKTYGDLDPHPDLILWTGRVERDGAVNVTRQAAAVQERATIREAADRDMHGDVEHLLGPTARD